MTYHRFCHGVVIRQERAWCKADISTQSDPFLLAGNSAPTLCLVIELDGCSMLIRLPGRSYSWLPSSVGSLFNRLIHVFGPERILGCDRSYQSNSCRAVNRIVGGVR